MHLGPPIGRGGLPPFREPVHRGQRRKSEPGDVAAKRQRGIHVHDDTGTPAHGEAIGPGEARPVEQRIDDDRILAGLGRLEPDMGEIRKFLRLVGYRDIDRDAPRRQTILVELANGAEIGRAEEGHPIVAAPVERLPFRAGKALAALLKAESRKAGIVRQCAGGTVGGHVEQAWRIEDLARVLAAGLALHHMHAHRLLEIAAEMEKRHRVVPGAVREQSEVGLVADPAMGVVIDRLKHVRFHDRLGGIGPAGKVASTDLQHLIGKWRRAAEIEPLLREGR